MARYHPKRCRDCGVPASADVPISAQGYCAEHGDARMRAAALQIRAQSGPYFERWARRSLMAMHRRLLAAERGSGVESEA